MIAISSVYYSELYTLFGSTIFVYLVHSCFSNQVSTEFSHKRTTDQLVNDQNYSENGYSMRYKPVINLDMFLLNLSKYQHDSMTGCSVDLVLYM